LRDTSPTSGFPVQGVGVVVVVVPVLVVVPVVVLNVVVVVVPELVVVPVVVAVDVGTAAAAAGACPITKSKKTYIDKIKSIFLSKKCTHNYQSISIKKEKEKIAHTTVQYIYLSWGSGSGSAGSACFRAGSGSGSFPFTHNCVERTEIYNACKINFLDKIFKTEDNVPAGKFIRGADPNPELDLHQNVTDPQHWHQLTHMINLLIHSQWVNPI